MTWFSFFHWVNESILAVPTTIIFFGSALFLTYRTRFVQFRMFFRCSKLLIGSIGHLSDKNNRGINPFHAVFTAMATTMGMGNVVGPSIALFTGGPGALFWLLVYILFGSVTKFTEVVFALRTRTVDIHGNFSGGPMHYLRKVHPLLALWYGFIMLGMFASWSSLQANTLAGLLAQEGVPVYVTGIGILFFLIIVLQGGAKRVSLFASKAVPVMFFLYVSVCLYILFSHLDAVYMALILIKNSVFAPCAAMGAFCGATIFRAMHTGLYQGIFITEAGIGTASIPHALANTDHPIDQGLLALYATISDFILAGLSGLLVLVTGVWQFGEFRSTFIYEAFKMHAPGFGSYVLLLSLSLFIITTIIGNSFNGIQIFGVLLPRKSVLYYLVFLLFAVLAGSLVSAPLVWEIMQTVLAFAVFPNIIGLLVLALRRPQDLLV